MGRTRHAIARLMDLTPEVATLADDEGRAAGSVRVEALVPGQRILVRPGSASPPMASFTPAAARWTRRRSPASRCRCTSSPATRCMRAP